MYFCFGLEFVDLDTYDNTGQFAMLLIKVWGAYSGGQEAIPYINTEVNKYLPILSCMIVY